MQDYQIYTFSLTTSLSLLTWTNSFCFSPFATVLYKCFQEHRDVVCYCESLVSTLENVKIISQFDESLKF